MFVRQFEPKKTFSVAWTARGDALGARSEETPREIEAQPVQSLVTGACEVVRVDCLSRVHISDIPG